MERVLDCLAQDLNHSVTLNDDNMVSFERRIIAK